MFLCEHKKYTKRGNRMNPFPYSLDNKRYHTFNYHVKQKYGTKVAKICLNASFTCPNRDGTKGYGGCIFCSSKGSGDFAGDSSQSLLTQFESQVQKIHKKWPNCKYIAYFQANTNTYGTLDQIKSCIDPFIHKEGVVAIAIATRADCLSPEIIEYLISLQKHVDVWIELGLQTIHNQTATFINRGHTYEEFLEGLSALQKANLNVCVHIINSLPYETKEMMLATIKKISQLDIQAIKIHMLYICHHTTIASLYQKSPFTLLSRKQYIDLVVEQLSYLPPHIIIERVTGDGDSTDLIAPLWSLNKTTILNDIDKAMVAKNYYQGCQYQKMPLE